ncbi:oxidoreductase activity protein [Paramecium bursaria]
MAFVLEALPWAQDSLNPYISANTVSFHYGKHHAGYVAKLNDLTKGTEWEKKTLTQVVLESYGNPNTQAIFNNSAQTWNHTFYWHSLRPQGGGAPTGVVKDLILQTFDTVEKFNTAFKDAALAQFGSGWTWLVEKDGKVSILKTANADNPINQGYRPLITLDVWEHAYYLDYQNRRADYASIFLDNLVNWDFANQNLQAAPKI